MRLLIARAPSDAGPLVAELEARGHVCLVQPLYRVLPQAVELETLAEALDGVQALLFTSANGARAFAALTARRDLAVFAVGDATAAAARGAGFETVESAGGNVEDLAHLVITRLKPADGPLFHAAAREVAGDLQGRLGAARFTLRRLVLYEARPLARLSDDVVTALEAGTIDAGLFFSPRSGASFVRLVREANLQGQCRPIEALCLSAAVAEAVAGLPWAGTRTAARPDTAALLEIVDELTAQPMSAGSSGKGEAATAADNSNAKDGQLDEKQDKEPNGTDAAAQPEDGQSEAPALAVISAFGGIRPMAAKLGIAVSTVQGWRERAAIPQARHEEIQAAAQKHDVELDAALLAASDRPQGPGGQSAGAETSPRSSVPQSGGARAEPVQQSDDGEDEPPVAAQERAHPPPQAARRGGGGWAFFLLGAIVFAAGAAAAVVTQPQWQPLAADLLGVEAPGSSDLEQRLIAAEANIDELDDLLGQLVAVPLAEPTNGAAVARLDTAIDTLNARLDALDASTGAAADPEAMARLMAATEQLGARLDALEEGAGTGGGDPDVLQEVGGELDAQTERLGDVEGRLAALEDAERAQQGTLDELAEASREASESSGGAAVLALAIAQLRDALRDGAAFAAELQQLRGLSHDDPALASLLDPLALYAAATAERAVRPKAGWAASCVGSPGWSAYGRSARSRATRPVPSWRGPRRGSMRAIWLAR